VVGADDPRFSNVPRVPYELPDGTIIHTGIERFRVPEILMSPDPVANLLLPVSQQQQQPQGEDNDSVGEGGSGEWSKEGLGKMATESLLRCDRDMVGSDGRS